MPKTNFCKDPNEKARRLLVGNIEKKMIVENKDKAQLSKCLGITPKTLRLKLEDPDGFKLSELLTIFKILKFSDTEIMESMGRA